MPLSPLWCMVNIFSFLFMECWLYFASGSTLKKNVRPSSYHSVIRIKIITKHEIVQQQNCEVTCSTSSRTWNITQHKTLPSFLSLSSYRVRKFALFPLLLLFKSQSIQKPQSFRIVCKHVGPIYDIHERRNRPLVLPRDERIVCAFCERLDSKRDFAGEYATRIYY